MAAGEGAGQPGLIPAGAGNTSYNSCVGPGLQAHPRRRGEHVGVGNDTGVEVGSSPQARGTPNIRSQINEVTRLIPAGAGNTQYGWGCVGAGPAHPRRRGEHRIVIAKRAPSSGSSPQARGTLEADTAAALAVRLIPAGAGNTATCACRVAIAGAHPRRRGEHAIASMDKVEDWGSSPQARGTPQVARPHDDRPGLIPAGAGNTPRAPCAISRARAHPRRRGEHSQFASTYFAIRGSSPQARGTLRR